MNSNNGPKTCKNERAPLYVSQCYTTDVTNLNNVKQNVTSLPGDKCIMYKKFQNNLPHNDAQSEVFFDNVSQNVFNLTGRHNIASQSNSKSAQDGGRSNIGGGICHDSCVVGHFASTKKRSVPVPVMASLSIKVHLIAQVCVSTTFSSQIGTICQIITLLTLYTFKILPAETIFFGWLGTHGIKR